MSRTITFPAVLILCAACGQDFELNAIQDPPLEGEDTALWVDSGEPVEPAEPFEEEEEPPPPSSLRSFA